MGTIRELQGVGVARARLFEQKNISTIEDLLYFFPREYEDRTKIVQIADLAEGETAAVKARIFSPVRENRIRKNMTIYTAKVCDDTGVMSIVWYNNRFVKGQFQTGEEYIFFGKAARNKGLWEFANPIHEKTDAYKYIGKIMPIYPLSANITQKMVQNMTAQALQKKNIVPECLPLEIRNEYHLAEINFALQNMHYPSDMNARAIARRRFAFEELYLLQLTLLEKKKGTEIVVKTPYQDISCVEDFVNALPFSLTHAQERVIEEICGDFTSGHLMMRLVQGDVGSGKTAVAAAAMYIAVKNGFQSVIMAPTEILAAQHYETFSSFFKEFNINLVLLTGSSKKKKEIHRHIAEGSVDIIIGTHAVIQKDVGYRNLGLVVVDEQHRFGVSQRAALLNKGENPHCLVMSATPIPRTLALILYGDLDISILDELPPGRKAVETYAVGEAMRSRIHAFIEKNVKNGSQVYVVCPLIEETEKSDLTNASDIAEKLQTTFPYFHIGLIHGKMKAKEKDEIMEQFVRREIDILVSTTVIEVGVNVPNSNVMIIENAERFGLSQLHQLRGRVGRGSEQAYCILFSDGKNEVTQKRMETMTASNDGFYISEQDLKLRGPGDFFGTRQHGVPELKVANLFEDMALLTYAQEAARRTVLNEVPFREKEREELEKRKQKILSDNVVIN